VAGVEGEGKGEKTARNTVYSCVLSNLAMNGSEAEGEIALLQSAFLI